MAAYLVVCNAARGIDYGTMNGYTSYTQASWQAARLVRPSTRKCKGYRLPVEQLQLSITPTPDPDGLYHVAVEVSYPFTTVVNWPGVPSSVLLDHSVTASRSSVN